MFRVAPDFLFMSFPNVEALNSALCSPYTGSLHPLYNLEGTPAILKTLGPTSDLSNHNLQTGFN